MSVLPGAAHATIADSKITEYLLDASHPQGRGKASFLNSCGFTMSNWQDLKVALLNHPVTNSVSASTTTIHGEKYVVTCSMNTPDGRNPCIDSVWIIDASNPNPRFITAYPHP